jgi:hypothetical protein
MAIFKNVFFKDVVAVSSSSAINVVQDSVQDWK